MFVVVGSEFDACQCVTNEKKVRPYFPTKHEAYFSYIRTLDVVLGERNGWFLNMKITPMAGVSLSAMRIWLICAAIGDIVRFYKHANSI